MSQPDHPTVYFVNGEEESTTEDELSVRSVLEGAGFQPAEEYTLKSQNPPVDFDSDYNRLVKVHSHQRFDALHKGPTPTS